MESNTAPPPPPKAPVPSEIPKPDLQQAMFKRIKENGEEVMFTVSPRGMLMQDDSRVLTGIYDGREPVNVFHLISDSVDVAQAISRLTPRKNRCDIYDLAQCIRWRFRALYGADGKPVGYRITGFEDREEIEKHEKQVRRAKKADYDTLTGKLPNPDRLIEMTEEAVKKGFTPSAVWFMDFNDLKQVNTKYGEAKTDRVLKSFTKVLESTMEVLQSKFATNPAHEPLPRVGNERGDEMNGKVMFGRRSGDEYYGVFIDIPYKVVLQVREAMYEVMELISRGEEDSTNRLYRDILMKSLPYIKANFPDIMEIIQEHGFRCAIGQAELDLNKSEEPVGKQMEKAYDTAEIDMKKEKQKLKYNIVAVRRMPGTGI